jgi:ribulose-phosphate 3-epimerase
MNKVIPTVFAHNKEEFNERFSKIISLSKNIQIDFMDGNFVNSKSVELSKIPNLKKYNKNFEAHLMVLKPKKYISKAKRKGFKKIIFHYESLKDFSEISSLISKIHKKNLECFIAINPKTKPEIILPFINLIDGVLLMGVYPGKENQEFIPDVYKKIKFLRKRFPNKTIQIDGGVNLFTVKRLKSSGANIINTGSFVNDSKKPRESLKKLRKLFV